MKNLYTDIKGKEREINQLEKSMKNLRDYGFEISEGELPTLRQSAERCLDNPLYHTNFVVRRMRQGEKLEAIVSDIASRRKYRLKFGQKKRKEYNEEVDDLVGVIPGARSLKRSSFFGFPQVATFPILIGTLCYCVAKGILSYVGAESTEEVAQETINAMPYYSGGFGVALGSLMSIPDILRDRTKNILSNMKGYVEYIDRSLGRN